MRLTSFLIALLLALPLRGADPFSKPGPVPAVPQARDLGWKPNPEELKRVAESIPRVYFAQAADLAKDESDKDALLFRFLQAARGQRELQPRDQGNTGSCVGYGTAAAIDQLAAVQIHFLRARELFHKTNADAIYAIGRIKAGQLGSWDGSTGAWSVEGIKELGCLFQMEYPGGFNLSLEKDSNARTWASRGLPESLLKLASEHRVLAAVLLKDANQLRSMLQNGYPAIICSNVGFENGNITQRDGLGFAQARGQWNHCMACISYRGPPSGREGWLIWNSWNPSYISGPVWPEDQPVGSFWVDRPTIEKMIGQHDSWALSTLEGFKKRELTWTEVIGNAGGSRKPIDEETK